MKRRYGIIAVLGALAIVLCLCMTGCDTGTSAGEKQPATDDTNTISLEAYGTGITDNNIGTVGLKTYPLWSDVKRDGFTDENAPETMTVSFNGETYTGTYKRTILRGYNGYLEHDYVGVSAQKKEVEFSVHAVTGELTYFHIDTTFGLKISEDEAEKIAFVVADQYIDREKYVKTAENINGRIIVYEFWKYIDDVETFEVLSLSITGEGEVFSVTMHSIGAFPSTKEKLSAVNQKKFDALKGSDGETFAITQAKKICPDGYTVTSKVEKGRLVALEDGEYGMLYNVWIEKPISEAENEAGTIELLVK